MSKCESVEDFLSRGGQIEYCAPADERMLAVNELDGEVSCWHLENDITCFERSLLRDMYDLKTFERVDNCYWAVRLPGAQ